MVVGDVAVEIPKGYGGWFPDAALLESGSGIERRLVLTPNSARQPVLYMDAYRTPPAEVEREVGVEWESHEELGREIDVRVNGRLAPMAIREVRDAQPAAWVVSFMMTDTYYELAITAGSDEVTTRDIDDILRGLFPE